MARAKRKSVSAEFAQKRADALAAIDPNLDLGTDANKNPITLAAYQAATTAVANKNDKYNTLLSTADGLAAELQTDEKNLDTLSTTMLLSVAVKYGKDSPEYGKAGGTRTSDRKKIYLFTQPGNGGMAKFICCPG
jgi:glutamate-1-semialdehyde aminotransferase